MQLTLPFCASRLLPLGIALLLAACSSDAAPTTPEDNSPENTDPESTDTQTDADAGGPEDSNGRNDTDSDSGDDSESEHQEADAGSNGTDTDSDTFDDSETGSDTGSDGDTDADADTDTAEDPTLDSDTNPDVEDSDVVDNETVTRHCDTDCADFPEAPLLESEVTAEEIALFEDKDEFTGPGPCVVEPQLSDDAAPGALFPADWIRPRFRFVPGGEADLFEIRLEAERQRNDLVVYTRNTEWTLPEEIWNGLRGSVIDEPITVTIRALNTQSPDTPKGTRGTFAIAPVKAGGSIIYWAAVTSNVTPESGKLAVFDIGETDVADALTVNQAGDRDLLSPDGRQERSASYGVGAGCVQCIGCHAILPDGTGVAFGDHWPWNIVTATLFPSNDEPVGAAPAYVTPGAELLLNQPWLGMPAFSPAHYNDDERILLTSYGERTTATGGTVGYTFTVPTRDVLAWFDLTADTDLSVSPEYEGDIGDERNRLTADALGVGFGILELAGESLSVASPDWSHDGKTVAYTAASKTQDGRIGGGYAQTDVDLHTVPYNDGLGGTVSCIEGACEKDAAEYYPAFSADDRLIAFNKEANFRAIKTVTTAFDPPHDNITIDGSLADVYYRPHAEIYAIPSGGGAPIRLRANDPPRCTGEVSPGIINSRPRWSPQVSKNPDTFGKPRSFYWLVFSSARSYPEQFIVDANQYSPQDTRSSQLYIAAVVRDETTGEYTTFPAVYIWNQEKHASNLTPAWSILKR